MNMANRPKFRRRHRPAATGWDDGARVPARTTGPETGFDVQGTDAAEAGADTDTAFDPVRDGGRSTAKATGETPSDRESGPPDTTSDEPDRGALAESEAPPPASVETGVPAGRVNATSLSSDSDSDSDSPEEDRSPEQATALAASDPSVPTPSAAPENAAPAHDATVPAPNLAYATPDALASETSEEALPATDLRDAKPDARTAETSGHTPTSATETNIPHATPDAPAETSEDETSSEGLSGPDLSRSAADATARRTPADVAREVRGKTYAPGKTSGTWPDVPDTPASRSVDELTPTDPTATDAATAFPSLTDTPAGILPARTGDHSDPRDVAWDRLGAIPVDERVLDRNRIVSASRYDPAHVQFDVLRTRLVQALAERNWSRVAITSPTKGCGKTFTAANLGIALSRQSDVRTLVLDLDLRRPSLHKVFGRREGGAIGDMLRGRTAPETHLKKLGPNGFNAGRGIAFGFNDTPEPYPAELLQDPRTAETLDELEAIYEPSVMLFDLPPALAADDVLALRPHFDAVLLVVGGGLTNQKEIREVERRLGEDTPLLGIVLNRAEGANSKKYAY
ncbi:exopolysaccharide biosynthesis protein [Roseivivax marinus]|uniref:nucleotide-binding protein n=1 Tax=Roseivivax marinus TaxID=1379903 RepID=UPI001F03916F|nr:exopolysaccharide biosynthesis protein [Roseivivax marinus]UMA64379.1 exopolysaccharide biosynthesis protein [Roseivivax marinus]